MIGCVAIVVDGQVQGVSAGASVIVGIDEGICTCGVVLCPMPSVAVARSRSITIVCRMVNCQVEEYKTIASSHVGS